MSQNGMDDYQQVHLFAFVLCHRFLKIFAMIEQMLTIHAHNQIRDAHNPAQPFVFELASNNKFFFIFFISEYLDMLKSFRDINTVFQTDVLKRIDRYGIEMTQHNKIVMVKLPTILLFKKEKEARVSSF